MSVLRPSNDDCMSVLRPSIDAFVFRSCSSYYYICVLRSSSDVFIFRSRRLTLPSYSADRLASVLDATTGDVFYVGPGRYEVH